MPEFDYQNVEAFNTAVRLAASVGRLRIVSNLKASAEAQTKAFEQAGMAAALIAEGASREGGAQVAMYRDARGSLAQCRAWLHVLALVTNEQDQVFMAEFDLADQASRQIGALPPQPRTRAPGRARRRRGATSRHESAPGGQAGRRPSGPRGNQR